MKTNKFFMAALIAVSAGMSFTACSDEFLDETQITQHDTRHRTVLTIL